MSILGYYYIEELGYIKKAIGENERFALDSVILQCKYYFCKGNEVAQNKTTTRIWGFYTTNIIFIIFEIGLYVSPFLQVK